MPQMSLDLRVHRDASEIHGLCLENTREVIFSEIDVG